MGTASLDWTNYGWIHRWKSQHEPATFDLNPLLTKDALIGRIAALSVDGRLWSKETQGWKVGPACQIVHNSALQVTRFPLTCSTSCCKKGHLSLQLPADGCPMLSRDQPLRASSASASSWKKRPQQGHRITARRNKKV